MRRFPRNSPYSACALDTPARQNANEFAFALAYPYLWLRLNTSSQHNQADACFRARFSVSLTSSKILPFGNVQINLTLLSLIRIFVADSTFPYDEILRIPPRPAPRSAALRGRLPPVDALRHGRGFRTRNDLPHQSPDDPAGRRNLHRSHGARRRDETFDVDLRRDVRC